ncbi:polycystic kidney disease protein 1-like 2 [Salarias fasciatus]|uniref:polycystic kidney disease protein 1-like 2 n=1 Tax=Salarias fasciatus TaxID=181472 RepID=UPI001176B82B|nr:polycystic kidney disease protein 1-like 2 [Salarias fasciatus]
MGPFLQTSLFLWISAGLLFVPETTVGCPDFSTRCEFKLEDVCFEFIRDLKTWSQAKSSCEMQGGELLKVTNEPIKVFLNNISSKKNTSNFTWWLGEDIQGSEEESTADDLCPFMKLNPLRVTKSACNQKRGFLCTHAAQSPPKANKSMAFSHKTRSRLRRAVSVMGANVNNIHKLLYEADKELRRMELTVGEPTNDNRDDFIKYLLEGTKNLTSKFAISNNYTINHIINCSTGILLLSLKKCDKEENPNPVPLFERIFEIFREISLLIGEEISELIVFQHPSGTIYQTSKPPEEIGDLVLGSKNEGEVVKFPPSSALSSHLKDFSKVTAQVSTFRNNPHPSSENITGTLCNVQLSDGKTDIRLTGLTDRIEIFLPRPNASLSMSSKSVVLKENTKSVTVMNVSDANTTIFFSVKPSLNVSLHLNLTFGTPDAPKFSRNTTVVTHAEAYRWKITPEMLQYTPGIWHVDAKLDNSKWEPGLILEITAFMTKCLYWDEVKEVWSVDGCMVGDKSTPESTQCLCNHLTLFGSSFFVMPNHVDISRTTELFATVNQNYVVLALLCAFFGLYLITLIWACYADRRARHKRKLTLAEDNHPGSQYNYLISFQTGHRKNAGTSANVTVMLIGSEGESRIYNLADPDKPLFERGSVDMFVLSTPFPLGDIQSLRLQHDNSGGNPSWYINKVTIQDLQTRLVWHFLCGCWLSVDRGDGMTKKTFNAAKNNEIASFRNIFQSRTTTGFRDEHIWVSIVDPPSRSPFTRAQRVSCCMSLLLCTMAINIAFWNLPVDKDSGVIFSVGSMQITWQEVIVGVESGLLMFPINILIITIFRSIRPRVISKPKNEEAELGPPAVTVPAILKETDEVISMMSKSPRNKALEMSSLQSTADLLNCLDRVNTFVQAMQGETESDPHLVHSTRFLLAGLCHLLMSLEKLDVKHFSSMEEHQKIFSLANLLVRKTEMVFSSHLTTCPPPVKRKKRSMSCWLPWWFVFVGWFLLLSISGVSTFFTLLYGFQYGKEKSIKWVMSLGLSLFQSIFILQPLKVIGIAVVFALLLKPVAVEETEEVEQVLLSQQEKCKQYAGRML